MSSTAWGTIGAIVCVAGFQLLRYGVGKTASYVFVGIVGVAALIAHFIYQRRLEQLRDKAAEFSEEERVRFLNALDPEIAEDLRKCDNDERK